MLSPEYNVQLEKRNIKNMIDNVRVKYKQTGEIDYDKWVDRIYNYTTKYNIPKDVVIAIMAHETGGSFTEHISKSVGHGIMQITSAPIKNMFNVQQWQIDNHKNIDDNLFNDIVNKIHEHGCNNLKDTNKILELCGKDDELSMLIGIMRIKFTYVEAVRENI